MSRANVNGWSWSTTGRRLAGERIQHTTRSLAAAWSVNEREAGRRAERLIGAGVLG
jgi:hypothetical protein